MLMNLLTNSVPEGGKIVGVGEASIYALIGFAVVFLGIAFLIFVVWLVGKLMDKATNSTVSVNKQEKAQLTKPTETVQELAVASDELSEETVAVIMAALTAYYEKNNSKCEFVVKRIKRI